MVATHTHNFQVINPINRLAKKVHKDGGAPLDAIIAQADSALQNLGKQFATVARESIKAMRCSQLLFECRQSQRALKIISRECHDLKGQAVTFGFPFLGKAAAALDDFIRSHHDLALERHDIIKLHVDALEVLMEMKADDDKTKCADELLAWLGQAVSASASGQTIPLAPHPNRNRAPR